MVAYKSFCRQPKTFYGTTFHYGETKTVPGYIHDPRFVCLGTVRRAEPETQPKVEEVTPIEPVVKPAVEKKAAPKVEELKKATATKPEVKAEKPAKEEKPAKAEKKEEAKPATKDTKKKSADTATESTKKD